MSSPTICIPAWLWCSNSTTYPGTTREILLPKLGEASGLTVGEDFFLAFSPERVDPGREDWTTINTPKVIGGITEPCSEIAAFWYKQAIHTVVPVTSAEVAEMAKLLENTFRMVNIGLVNEMVLMCDRLGIDIWEVIDAASTKPFGFMKFTPGPGLGGHCIPIDPLYLSWKLRSLNYTAQFIDLASEINTNMPRYVVERVQDVLNDLGKPLKGSQILVLGAAYKPNVDDLRESPALDVIGLLDQKGSEVSYHDPYIPHIQHEEWELSSRRRSDDCGQNGGLCGDCHQPQQLQLPRNHGKCPADFRHAQCPGGCWPKPPESDPALMAKYLLTGAAGFIGARVGELLLDAGHTVFGVDNLNEAYDVRLKEYRLKRLQSQPGFTFLKMDITDREAVQALGDAEGPFEAIINLAARAGVRASVADPWMYLDTNTYGTLNLLELCRHHDIPKFILASTSSIYGAGAPLPTSEEAESSSPLQPYAASKKGAEAMSHAYHFLYGIDVTVFRYFTVYGPAGRPDMSMFRFTQWISEGRPVKVFGDGEQSQRVHLCR